MSTRNELARVIWETSRADEGTISATGADIVADALLASGAVTNATALASEIRNEQVCGCVEEDPGNPESWHPVCRGAEFAARITERGEQ